MKNPTKGIVGLILGFTCLMGVAQERYAFNTPQQAQAFEHLIKEIRCITCPNQNIAESEGGLAVAIKEELHGRLLNGEDPDIIRASLMSHYGEQILYRPSMAPKNWLLWWAPLGFCLLGFGIWWLSLHAKAR
jgi:cytochrome c-type biogenesis protein CcmH